MRILLINDHKRREGGAETFVYGLAGNLEIPDRYIGKPLNQQFLEVNYIYHPHKKMGNALIFS